MQSCSVKKIKKHRYIVRVTHTHSVKLSVLQWFRSDRKRN